ncbi:type VI secretion system amidase effector protein Tae4 [Pseudoalteromonas sp. DY56-GL22]|uniref:T6SS effector amidase Tae4 family protein n=1 Tax=Pseudoalteromonas sp. DY56-GL22 TaxID=2967126 RepID=UPI00352B7960
MVNFNDVKQNYPRPTSTNSAQARADLYNALGGEWPTLINNPNYANTCAIRLSIAIRKSGIEIPSQYKEAQDGAGNTIILKVKTLKNFIESQIGTPFWGISKQPGQPIGSNTLPSVKGIIVYHVAWADATGHFDLWNGNDFVGNGNFSDIQDGYHLAVWKLN